MELLLTVCLVLLAIILLGIALPILISVIVAIGVVIAIPFLWIADVATSKWARFGLWRDGRRAEKLGFETAYSYRLAKRRAEEEGITVDEYSERARKYREERGY